MKNVNILILQNLKSEPDKIGFLKSIAYSVKEDRKYDMELLYHRPGQSVVNTGYDNGYDDKDKL